MRQFQCLSVFFALVMGVGSISCRWRFHDCHGQPFNCLVEISRQCECDNASDCFLNSTIHNFTWDEARSVFDAQNSFLSELCAATCRVQPVLCQWQEWSEVWRICPHVRYRRKRASCCHPGTKKELPRSVKYLYNSLCIFSKYEYKLETYRCKEEKKAKEGLPKAEAFNLDEGLSPEITIGFIGLALFLIFLWVACCSKLTKDKIRQEAGNAAAQQGGNAAAQQGGNAAAQMPLRKTHTVPKRIIMPEPGQPISAERLPAYFRNS